MSGQSRFSCPIWVTTVMSPPLFCLVMFVVLMVHLFGLPVTHLEPNHALELFTLCSFSTSFFFLASPSVFSYIVLGSWMQTFHLGGGGHRKLSVPHLHRAWRARLLKFCVCWCCAFLSYAFNICFDVQLVAGSTKQSAYTIAEKARVLQ